MKCGSRVATKLTGDVSSESRLAATLLARFLAMFGAHRFYVGKTATAVVMLLLGIAGVATAWILAVAPLLVAVGIWHFVDFIMAATRHMRDNEGKLIQKW